MNKCEKAYMNILGKMVVIRTEKGGKAIVGLNSICLLAKKLGLCIENYQC